MNYISNVTSSPNKYWSFVTRVDHSFSDRNKLNATFFKAVLHQIQPTEGFPKLIAPTGVGYTVYRNNIGGSLDDVIVLSPTLVVDARIGVIYHPFGLIYPGSTFNLSTININGTGLPFQSFPGVFACDACTSPGGVFGYESRYVVALCWPRGRQYGADQRRHAWIDLSPGFEDLQQTHSASGIRR